MKKLMFLVSMVAAMFAFTSCEKEAEVNTIVLDGVAYNVTPHLGCTNERYFLDASNDQVSLNCDMFSENLGKTYDLSKQYTTDHFSIMLQLPETYIGMKNHPDFFGGIIGEQSYENESPFKSGKMTFAKDGDNYTFDIKGAELKNGQKLSIRLEITPNQYEKLDW